MVNTSTRIVLSFTEDIKNHLTKDLTSKNWMSPSTYPIITLVFHVGNDVTDL